MIRALQVAGLAGIPISLRHTTNGFQWDGKTLAISSHPGMHCEKRNLIHDVAHYMVAPKLRKYVPDFGLGMGPNSRTFPAYAGGEAVKVLEQNLALQKKMTQNRVSWYTGGTAEKEEQLASAFGILIEKYIGYDWEYTFVEHSWDRYLPESGDVAFDDVVKKLVKRGLVTEDNSPVFLIGKMPRKTWEKRNE